MNVFYFGDSARQLYGVLHPPKKELPQTSAVLLCYPFGQEYMRAHRAFRQLALLLSAQGFHVMRFDYSGTGDSSGDLPEVVFKDWVDDTITAANELQHASGASTVSVVGLRLGALVAAAAAEVGDIFDRLVVWDPVQSGGSYRQELIDQIADKPPNETSFIDADQNLHFNGFCLSQAFQSDMQQFDLLAARPKADQLLQIVSTESESAKKLRATWGALPGYAYRHTPSPGDWNYVDNFGGILLPQPVIQSVVNWFTELSEQAA